LTKYILYSFFLFWVQYASGQALKIVSESHTGDSSYYSIVKITDNEYWIGGEYGVLKKIDTNRTLSDVNYPNAGNSILKIKKFGNFVYLACEKGVFYKYNLITKIFEKKYFKRFKNKSFYDFVVLPNGKIVVCGGSTKVATGNKSVPHGFVAETDTSLAELNTVKNFPFSFVWSVCGGSKNEIYSAVYRPNVTRIGIHSDIKKWRKLKKINGLIYELQYFDTLNYCGFTSYKLKSGTFGDLQMSIQKSTVEGIWSMDKDKGNFILLTHSGNMVFWFVEDNFNMTIPISERKYPIYDIEMVRPGYYLMVGHGKGIWTFNFW